MIATTLLVLSLTFAAETKADGAKPDTKSYVIDTSATTAKVQVGKPGTFHMRIKAAEGYHVSAEAPLKIGLAAEGLELAKKQLGHDDAKDKTAASPEFTVSFGAPAAGDKAIQVDATFFVCSEKICERKNEKLNIPVSVRQ